MTSRGVLNIPGLTAVPSRPKSNKKTTASSKKLSKRRQLRSSCDQIKRNTSRHSFVKQEENKNCVSVMGGKREPPRRKVVGLANDCSNGIYIGTTEEELNSQKTLKKNVLKVFFEGGKNEPRAKYLRQLQALRSKKDVEAKTGEESKAKDSVDQIGCSQEKIVSTENRGFSARHAQSVENLETVLLKPAESTEPDFLDLILGQGPKKEPMFRANNLFQELHKDNESQELKMLRQEIDLFYRTSSELKVPPTGLNYYKLLKLIGKGSFGKVYLGLQILTSRLVAVKCLEKNFMKDRGIKTKILQEIEILKASSTVPGVAKLLEVFENKKYVFLVMVYAKGGDLLRFLKAKTKLTEPEARVIFLKILTGVCGLHARGILHRDIKLDNILLDEKEEPTICDFGVSRKMAEGEVINEQCGTPAYISPEIIGDQGYTGLKADVWSLGIMLFAMLTGKMPFKGSTIEELQHSISTGSYRFPSDSNLSQEARDLISKMVCVDVGKRLSSFEVLRDKWMGLTEADVQNILEKTMDQRVVIDEDIMLQIANYGYPEKAICESLNNKKLNHVTACYFNLERCLHN